MFPQLEEVLNWSRKQYPYWNITSHLPSDLWEVVISTPWAANKRLGMLAAFWVRGTCCWIHLGGLSTWGFCLVLLEGCPMYPRWGHWPNVAFIFFTVGFAVGPSFVPMAEQEGCSLCVLKRSNFYLTWLPCVMLMNGLPPYQLWASLLACAVDRKESVCWLPTFLGTDVHNSFWMHLTL